MRKTRFEAALFEGHKGLTAIIVPFDPEELWGLKPVKLASRGDGWRVNGTVNGTRFDGYIGYRRARFFILIEPELRAAAKLLVGDTLTVVVEPIATPKALAKPNSIDEYLATVTGARRAALEKLRKTIRSIVPAAEECISYRIPAFRLDGKVVAGFCARAHGCSYFPFSGRTLQTLAKDLGDYETTKGALHFNPEGGLPTTLVRKLLKVRIAETR